MDDILWKRRSSADISSSIAKCGGKNRAAGATVDRGGRAPLKPDPDPFRFRDLQSCDRGLCERRIHGTRMDYTRGAVHRLFWYRESQSDSGSARTGCSRADGGSGFSLSYGYSSLLQRLGGGASAGQAGRHAAWLWRLRCEGISGLSSGRGGGSACTLDRWAAHRADRGRRDRMCWIEALDRDGLPETSAAGCG